jgi:hypothetical protein
VSTEHTPRNLLLRAVRSGSKLPQSEQARLVQQYVALTDSWGVTPRLEVLMREDGTLPADVLVARADMQQAVEDKKIM